MAYYLVFGRLREGAEPELHERLAAGTFESMRPFGPTLTRSLLGARWDAQTQQAVWELECYCVPPLRDEREQVLDTYFTAIEVEPVAKNEGWRRIADLPELWKR